MLLTPPVYIQHNNGIFFFATYTEKLVIVLKCVLHYVALSTSPGFGGNLCNTVIWIIPARIYIHAPLKKIIASIDNFSIIVCYVYHLYFITIKIYWFTRSFKTNESTVLLLKLLYFICYLF